MTTRCDELRSIADGLERGSGLRDTLKRIMDRYPDATAAEIADALRPVEKQAEDTSNGQGNSHSRVSGSPHPDEGQRWCRSSMVKACE
jgi:hypothetical protein